MCLHHIFLHIYKSHTTPAVWWNIVGCFVIALNAAINQQLLLADEGYKSGSDTIDLPTPLWKTPHIHHISSIEHASFNQFLPHLTEHHKLHPDQCIDACLLVQQSTTLQTALQYAQTAQIK